jgi:hypothetical protein
MNILLTLFLLFLVILLLFLNLKYRSQYTNYYDKRKNNSNNIIIDNYFSQLLKYIFAMKERNDNTPVKLKYFRKN